MIKKNYSELFEFTSAQLARLKKEYDPLKGKRLGMNQINKMNTMLSKYSTDMLMKLANADIRTTTRSLLGWLQTSWYEKER